MSNQKIYNSLKQGYKINIGQDIASRVRTLVFNEGWEQFGDEAVENILNGVMNNYFIVTNIQENEYLAEDIEELKQLIIEKIHIAFEKFATQEPTARQIYYYIHLCSIAGEKYQQLMNNKKVHIEIDRIIKLNKEKEEEKQREIEEHKQALHEFQYGGL